MGQAQQKEFDALEYVKELRDVGFKQEQAEVQARHLRLVKNDNMSNLATREELKHETALIREELKHETALIRKDIEQLRIDGNHQIELVKKEIKALDVKIETKHDETKKDIESAKKSTIIWLGGILGTLFLAGLGFIFTIARLGVFSSSQ